MNINELIRQWIREQRNDVSFPVFYEDTEHLISSEVYGFLDNGRSFRDCWRINPGDTTRITAAFTGSIYPFHMDGEEYALLIHIASPRPESLPWWYPIPRYIKYSPFTIHDLEEIARSLLQFQDSAPLESLLSPTVSDCGWTDLDQRISQNRQAFRSVFQYLNPEVEDIVEESISMDDINEIVRGFIDEDLTMGIPVKAGTILFKRNAGQEIDFHLHWANEQRVLDDSISFNLNFYFQHWSSIIDNYIDFPSVFQQNVIGPPLTTGGIRYVRSRVDPSDPSPNYTTIRAALDASNENDTVLILDNALYSEGLLVNKFISIIGLNNANDDATELDINEDSGTFVSHMSSLYPTITSGEENVRGVIIQYEQGDWGTDRTGIVYLSNLSIANNAIRTDTLSGPPVGGAGLFINGQVFDSDGVEQSRRFSNAHIHNCVIANNNIIGSYQDSPFMGGGIMMNRSSPLITQSVISHNESMIVGGGVGINNYSWPWLINNIIEYNRAKGNLDTTNEDEYGDDGDGGGIGILMARPNADSRDSFFSNYRDLLIMETLDALTVDRFRRELRAVWNLRDLRRAINRQVFLGGNRIRFNRATLSGGGVYGTICAGIDMVNNTIESNIADHERGGGVAASYGSTIYMSGDSISNNEAYDKGGGIYFRSTKAELTNVQITGNSLRTPTGSLIRNISGGPSFSGGGLCVESKQEIDGPSLAGQYDLILTIVFDHIDEIKLDLQGTQITGNTSRVNNSLYAFKGEYNGATRLFLSLMGLIDLPDLHVISDASCTFNAEARIEHPGGTRTINPGDDVTY